MNAMQMENPMLETIIRFDLGNGIRLGPGKVLLLEKIVETGSLSAAARAMDMSYKRAWQLIDEMNGVFSAPVVTTKAGGRKGGGAAVTAFGQNIVKRFRHFEQMARTEGRGDLKDLQKQLKPKANRKVARP